MRGSASKPNPRRIKQYRLSCEEDNQARFALLDRAEKFKRLAAEHPQDAGSWAQEPR